MCEAKNRHMYLPDASITCWPQQNIDYRIPVGDLIRVFFSTSSEK